MSMDQAAVLRCRFCGRAPALATTVRAHRGMVLMMQWRHLRGPFCRSCGLQAVKKLTTDTLWQGWWGLFSLFLGAPFALLSNLFAWRKLRGLPEPEGAAPAAAAAPTPVGAAAAPAPPVPGAVGASMPPPPPPPGAAALPPAE